MPIAAIPNYLQKNSAGQDDPEFYLSAPPGHRFLLYFASLGENQETNTLAWSMKDRVPKIDKKTKQPKPGEWEDLPNNQYACTIAAGKTPSFDDERPRKRRPATDSGLKPWRPLMTGLLWRQRTLFGSVENSAGLYLEALATAPFTTGLGNEHPLENGFAFLNPYGLPYLPGSGVKGVLRQAARELASGDWGDTGGWSAEKIHQIGRGKDTIDLSPLDALFGLESGNGETQHVRGALSFWDVIPQIKGDSLAVEIMTPHQSHYYQQKADRRTGDSTSPHDSGQPTPISFLTVPPGSGFAFHVTCDLAHLERLAPDLAADARWKTLLSAAFEHAFQWLGFGAKTAVGYGAMQSETQRQQQETDAAARKVQDRLQQELAAAQRQAETAIVWPGAQIKFNRANGSLSVKKEGREAIALAPKGRELLDTLPADVRKKIESGGFVKLTAYVSESVLVRIEAA